MTSDMRFARISIVTQVFVGARKLSNETWCTKLKHIVVHFLSAFTKLRKVTIKLRVRLLVRPSEWNDSAPNGRIFTKFCIRVFFFRKYLEKILV